MMLKVSDDDLLAMLRWYSTQVQFAADTGRTNAFLPAADGRRALFRLVQIAAELDRRDGKALDV